jgi:hypothetical protein
MIGTKAPAKPNRFTPSKIYLDYMTCAQSSNFPEALSFREVHKLLRPGTNQMPYRFSRLSKRYQQAQVQALKLASLVSSLME